MGTSPAALEAAMIPRAGRQRARVDDGPQQSQGRHQAKAAAARSAMATPARAKRLPPGMLWAITASRPETANRQAAWRAAALAGRPMRLVIGRERLSP